MQVESFMNLFGTSFIAVFYLGLRCSCSVIEVKNKDSGKLGSEVLFMSFGDIIKAMKPF